MSWFARNKTGSPERRKKKGLTLLEMAVFSMFAALMYASKIAMEALPNLHLIGMFTMLLTVVYRGKALIPLYLYILINGLSAGFAAWWLPYLYVWAVLWGATMLLPKRLPAKTAAVVYPLVCGLHGLAFGTLYAPAQALLYGFSFQQTLAWIFAGFPFDLLHGGGNLVAGTLVLPLSNVLLKITRNRRPPD